MRPSGRGSPGTGLVVRAAVALLALAMAAGHGSAAHDGCAHDWAVLDMAADGKVSVGDVVLSPPDRVGTVLGDHALLNRPLVAVPGVLSFFDLDANGAPSLGDVAAWDRGAAGRTPGDLLLGELPSGNASLPFGHVLAASDPTPPAGLAPYPGGGLGYDDANADGRRQPAEGAYGARGGTVSAADVRLDVEGWPAGSLVAGSDGDAGTAVAAGPVLGAVDEDGSGHLSVPSCPPPSTAPATTSTGPTSPGSDGTPTHPPTTGPGSPPPEDGATGPAGPGGSDGARGSPAPAAVAVMLVALGAAVAARRRLP